ncbi:FAD-binding oxidoreductase [Flavobacterium sp. MK4S-17]|uniref:NAD(P)/FAD-dependent oxidoreductase n=1 Tax=Flavobacterium sp. MK4S-17 TaxID=2543737 RepID=UPI001358E1C9|nr:FAD-binding oxidoreductase [Flavobacterium sp. MK4S-17]
MKDFIIVGGGLAGLCFAETAFLHGKTFTLISDTSHNATGVAAGLYNPVILKRFSLPADAALHREYMLPFYDAIEKRLDTVFMHQLPIYRRFATIEEQNTWFEAADKPALSPFLITEVIHTKYTGLTSPFGFGRVAGTGYMDTMAFINAYQNHLDANGCLKNETFDYKALQFGDDFVSYKGIKASHIIFAEGFGLHANPYFANLPLDGTKGELLIIKAPELKLDVAVNAGIFILPVGNNIYKVGATYEWDDKTVFPTEQGKKELKEKLEEIITCSYEIIGHLAEVRPTVKDRKPLIGTHVKHKRLHLLNGLGTRGVMLGPYMAKLLYESVVEGKEIPKAVNFTRFKV